jgi:hypothetical protein
MTGAPPPYPSSGGQAPPPQPRRPRRRGPNRFFTLLIGLVIGAILGVVGGYLAFNGKTVSIASNQPQASASASTSPTAVPATPTALATQPPVATAAAAGVVPCPITAPPNQHPLGTPGPAGSGQNQNAGLDFCGRSGALIPTGTARFMTNGNWGVGIADSCPQGSAGQTGMGVVLTVSELLPGGGQGPDSATESGDWADSGSLLMRTGGNFQLKVTTASADCVWHIAIYPS